MDISKLKKTNPKIEELTDRMKTKNAYNDVKDVTVKNGKKVANKVKEKAYKLNDKANDYIRSGYKNSKQSVGHTIDTLKYANKVEKCLVTVKFYNWDGSVSSVQKDGYVEKSRDLNSIFSYYKKKYKLRPVELDKEKYVIMTFVVKLAEPDRNGVQSKVYTLKNIGNKWTETSKKYKESSYKTSR